MTTYAIIETGSKQYCVEPNSVIEIELIAVPEGKKAVSLDNVLLVREGKKVHVGTPTVKGAKVVCDFLGEVRGKKVISFKMRRRKGYKRKQGHRQNYTKLLVKEITLSASAEQS